MNTVMAQQYETVDDLAYRITGSTDLVEAIYAHNPGLAEHGPRLPLGTRVNIPEMATAAKVRPRTTLWS